MAGTIRTTPSAGVAFENSAPVTQELAAGLALARYLSIDEELPEKITLWGGAQLTLSSKKDCWYYTTARSCTCPAGQFHKICKHVRDLNENLRMQQKAMAAEA